jgi:HSP20 family protein
MNSLITRRSYPTSPFASLLNLSRDFDRILETPWTALPRDGFQGEFLPAMELHEDNDSITVSLELPGIDKKDVSITFPDNVLTVSGERKQEREVKENEVLRSERYYGRFERQVGLGQPVVADKVKAAYKDGVLRITLPKAAEAKAKTIDIATS